MHGEAVPGVGDPAFERLKSLAGGTNIPEKGSFMHAVKVTLGEGDKPVGTARFELTRQK